MWSAWWDAHKLVFTWRIAIVFACAMFIGIAWIVLAIGDWRRRRRIRQLEVDAARRREGGR